MADAFDETEYAEHRSLITDQLRKLQAEISRLEENLMHPEQFEERKQEILTICQNARRSGLVFDAPFELRQRIILTIVDKITLNANEGWFELEGVVTGPYLFDDREDASDETGGREMSARENVSIVYSPAPADIMAIVKSPARAP